MAVARDPELRRAKAVLFDTHLAPLMREFEFVRDRRVYRRFNADGDCVLVDIQPSRSGRRHEHYFYVVVAVAPKPWLEASVARGLHVDFAKPEQTSGLSDRLQVPDRPWSDTWIIDSVESADRVGAALVDTLRPWLAELVRMLDSAYLLDRMRTDPDYPFGVDRESVLAVLLAEHGMDDQLAALLDQFDDWHRNRDLDDDEPEDTPPTPSPFAAWIRARAIANSADLGRR